MADEPDLCATAYDQLIEEDFTGRLTRCVFGALCRLRDRGATVPDVTLVLDELRADPNAPHFHADDFRQMVGGEYAHIAALPSEIQQYVRRLLENRVRRSLLASARSVVSSIEKGGETPQAAAETLQRAIDDGMLLLTQDRGVSYADALVSGIQRAANRDRHLRTGFGPLDANIGGFAPGELIVLAARPFLGKTVFCCNMAIRMAASVPVEFWTLEMDVEEIARIMWQASANQPLPSFEHMGREDLLDEANRLANLDGDRLPITLHEYAPSVEDLIGQMAQAKRARGSKVMFVDNLHLLSSRTAGKVNRAQELAVISRRLKMAAKDLQVAVVCIAHLNRAIESREDRRPKLSDLRDSGTIEQDADAVLFLHSKSYYQSADEVDSSKPRFMRLYAEKRRGHGRSFTKLVFDPGRTRFDAHTENDSAEFS